MIQYYKAINKLDKISWSKEPRKLTLNNESYPGYSLRRQVASLYKEPITNCRILLKQNCPGLELAAYRSQRSQITKQFQERLGHTQYVLNLRRLS